MPPSTTVDDIIAKLENTVEAQKETMKEQSGNEAHEAKVPVTEPPMENVEESAHQEVEVQKNQKSAEKEEEEEAEIPVEVEAKTGVSFPVRLEDKKQLKAVGLRKKSMLGVGIKIYAFGIYADNEKLKALLMEKFGPKAPGKATKEMYQMVIDSDIGMMVRLVIVFSSLTMSMVRKNFDEGLGAAIKKLTGAKNDELTKKIMGEASDDIKLSPGSVIEISRDPGYLLQTKVKGEVVSKMESELLCRAYMYLYLGDDPFDKEAKDKFGNSMLSLF